MPEGIDGGVGAAVDDLVKGMPGAETLKPEAGVAGETVGVVLPDAKSHTPNITQRLHSTLVVLTGCEGAIAMSDPASG